MTVIQNLNNQEKYMYPTTNINKETPTGFEQYQAIPKGFKIAEDQTPVPIHYTPIGHQVELVLWEAHSKDPLNTLEETND